MNPYRENAHPREVKHKPRPLWKTLYLKLLIKLKGKWRDRFLRCQYCKKFVMENDHGWNSEMFFHQMKCLSISLQERKRLKEQHFQDTDELGPLR